MPVIPALWRWRQEGQTLEVILDYICSPWFKASLVRPSVKTNDPRKDPPIHIQKAQVEAHVRKKKKKTTTTKKFLTRSTLGLHLPRELRVLSQS